MTMNGGLLDDLAQLAHCAYLSDLRLAAASWQVALAVRRLEPERYPLAEWTAAAAYLTGRQHDFASPHEAWEYLQGKTGAK